MERRLKERLIGAAVLVMLAVIFIPMVLDDSAETDMTITETNIPARPQDNFNSRIVPLEDSDLTPVVEETQVEVDLATAVEATQAPVPDVVTTSPGNTDTVEIEKQAPVPKLPSKASKNTQVGATAWVVQLGSFNSEDNALGLNEKLRKAGYPAFVEPLKRESGMTYRVRVGPELLRSDAIALQAQLSSKMKIEGIVVRYP